MNAIIYTTNTGSTGHYLPLRSGMQNVNPQQRHRFYHGAKGALLEKAAHFDGEIPLF